MESSKSGIKTKWNDPNRGFKTAEDGRLIISDKALRGVGKGDEDIESSSEDDDDEGVQMNEKKTVKRGMEDDSSDGKYIYLISSICYLLFDPSYHTMN